MSNNQNIDKVFRNASEKYAPQAPNAVWEKLEANLAAKRRRKMIWWWLTPLLALIIGSLAYFYTELNYDSSPDISLCQPIEKTENQTNNLDEKSATSSIADIEIEENSIQESLVKKQSIDSISHEPNNINTGNSEIAKSTEINIIENPNTNSNLNIRVADAKEEKVDSIVQNEISEDEVSNISIIVENTNIFDSSRVAVMEFKENQGQLSKINAEEIEAKDTIKENEQIIADEISLIENIDSNKSTLPNNEQKKPKEKKLHLSFFIAYQLGFGTSGGFYKEPNPDILTISTTSKLTSSSEKGSEFSGGFYLNNWMLKVGLQSFDLNMTGDFSMPDIPIKYVQMDYFGISPMGYYSVENVANVLESKNYNSVDYLRNFTKTRFLISMSSFSLEAGRVFNFGNLRLQAHAGYNSASIKTSLIEAGDEFGFVDFGKIHDLRTKIHGLSFGGDIIYQSKSAFFIGLKTDFVFYLNSINSSKEFEFYPYRFIGGPQVGFKF